MNAASRAPGSAGIRNRISPADLGLIVLFLVLDQLSKQWAVSALGGGQAIPLIRGILELTYVQNQGAAFGILQNARIFFFIITLAALIMIGMILVRMPAAKQFRPARICLLLIASGAIGNLIDRVLLGYVRDFIYFSLIDFPVFNVADICITCSTFVLVLLMLFYYKEEDLAFLSGTERKEQEDHA